MRPDAVILCQKLFTFSSVVSLQDRRILWTYGVNKCVVVFVDHLALNTFAARPSLWAQADERVFTNG